MVLVALQLHPHLPMFTQALRQAARNGTPLLVAIIAGCSNNNMVFPCHNFKAGTLDSTELAATCGLDTNTV